MRRLALLMIVAVLAVLAGGCGSPARTATLMLDFTPNAVHAGIYSAMAHHLGARVRVLTPSATTDSIKLLEAGRVDFAILDIHDLAIARERGAPIVGIMAVVQRPLAAVVASPRIRTPRQLQGATVGITGVPSDTAVLRSVVAGAGGDPGRVRTVTIGFNAVADLLAGRVAAATAFWSDEGVTLAQRRPGFHSFKVDDYRAPSYPELVVCATTATLRRNHSLATAVVRTLQRGYGYTLAHPGQSARDLESRVPGLDPSLVKAELRALLPAFSATGQLNRARLEAWAGWEARFGIVSRPPNVSTTFDTTLAR
jgi:NitT/TauT family transport system substrate-binding protein/putative hydroxymethylpyrimidine transport system substrate-binding protein